MKKISKSALGVASLGALLAPLVIISSCSSSTDIKLDINPLEVEVVLNIADIENEEYKKISNLEKLFKGIKKEDIENIKIEIDRATNTITLTANKGYIFSGNLPSISKEFQLENTLLEIEVKNNLETILITDIQGEQYKSIETLQKLFNIKESDLEFIKIVIEQVDSNFSRYTITLTTNDGYIFNNNAKTLALTFSLTPILVQISTHFLPKTIELADIQGEKYKSIETLQKVFYIEEADLEFLEVVITPNVTEGVSTYSIILFALPGYILPVGPNIMYTFTLITTLSQIEVKENPDSIYILDIEGEKYKSIETLQKLFNIDEFDLKFIKKITPNFNSNTASYTLVLTANDSYIFSNGIDNISSKPYKIILPQITLKTTPDPINILDIEGEKYKSIETLQKLFNINESDLRFVEITMNIEIIDGISTYTISLDLIFPGNIFIDGTTKLTTSKFTLM